MNRKQAHQRKNKYSIYCRGERSVWLDDYTNDQFVWLLTNGHLKWSEPMVHLGESPDERFFAFTKKGRRWYDWYTLTFWQWLKVYVFRVYYLRHLWQCFRIKCGHRYPWQDIDDWEM